MLVAVLTTFIDGTAVLGPFLDQESAVDHLRATGRNYKSVEYVEVEHPQSITRVEVEHLIEEAVDGLGGRIDPLEAMMGDLENRVTNLETQVQDLET
jgi:hypothetical protein